MGAAEKVRGKVFVLIKIYLRWELLILQMAAAADIRGCCTSNKRRKSLPGEEGDAFAISA